MGIISYKKVVQDSVRSYLIFRTSANEVKVAEKPTELEVEKSMDRQSSAESGIQESFANSPKIHSW